MRRVHPKTGQTMEEHRCQDGSLWGLGLKLYSNLRPNTDPSPMPEGYYEYVPQPKPEIIKVPPGVTQAAVEARRKRILEKERLVGATMTTVQQSGSGADVNGPSMIPSGSKTNQTKSDTPCIQDDPRSQAVEGVKKRRIIGKQKPTLYPQPNMSSKRKAEEQKGNDDEANSPDTKAATETAGMDVSLATWRSGCLPSGGYADPGWHRKEENRAKRFEEAKVTGAKVKLMVVRTLIAMMTQKRLCVQMESSRQLSR